jgi:predicted small lipoprotein YifL
MMDHKLALLLALSLSLLSACGNKGALYIPEEAPAPAAVEKVNAPAATEPAATDE